jgi:hypothetical protein
MLLVHLLKLKLKPQGSPLKKRGSVPSGLRLGSVNPNLGTILRLGEYPLRDMKSLLSLKPIKIGLWLLRVKVLGLLNKPQVFTPRYRPPLLAYLD